MILIIASVADSSVPFVTAKLDALNATYTKFDPLDFPKDAGFSVRYDRSGAMRRVLKSRQQEIDPDLVTAVWTRARTRIRPVDDPAVAEEVKGWVSEGRARMLTEFWECLDCFWLPVRPRADRDPYLAYTTPYNLRQSVHPPRLPTPSAHNKLHQLAVAGRLGFALPRTLVTNSPEDFLGFYEECDGQLISKSPLKMPATRNGEEVTAYTHALRRRNAAAYQSIRYVPVVFQERVPKKLELRVTVVGRKVFAAAIQSQESARLSVDWRHYPQFAVSKDYSVYDLPGNMETRCADLIAELGLCFGAIDLIVTPAGDYVFLEVNPNGQWTFIEEYTGLPIAQAVAEMLVRGAV